MNLKDRKQAVLYQLSRASEPISLRDLLEQLGPDYPERTVRRWLHEMVDEGIIKKIGKKRGTKYLASGKQERLTHEGSSCFSSKSLQILTLVNRPLYERNPIAYNDDWFKRYEPNQTFYLPHHFRTQLYEAGIRSSDHDPAGTYAHKIFDRLLIDLSYNSARLEGNTYSRLDTEKLLIEGQCAEDKLDEEKVMILNHKEAIRYLVDNADRMTISTKTILTLHYLLSDGLVDPKYAGKYRDHGVRIGGSTYIPYEDPRLLEKQLGHVIQKAADIQDPFEQSFFLLVHISYLQAFTDVNKRTARLSANIPFITQNFVPLSFNDVSMEDYISAILAIYELQEVRPLADLFIFSYMRTCAAYDSTVKAIGFDEVRVRFRQQRRALIRNIILQKLVGDILEKTIALETERLIPEGCHQDFIDDVYEDIEQIDEARIAGLGITPDQFLEWMEKRSSECN